MVERETKNTEDFADFKLSLIYFNETFDLWHFGGK